MKSKSGVPAIMVTLIHTEYAKRKEKGKGKKIKTGKNLNPVQKFWEEVKTFGGEIPQKDA
jgi:hypothetical protein